MATSPHEQAPPVIREETDFTKADADAEAQGIEGRAPEQKPLGFLRMMVILISSHVGVRSRANREEDFQRANGLHVFIAGVVYFAIVIFALVLLVNLIVA